MTIKFPERQYLTFEELKVRWQCNDGDLRYLIVHGDLKPSVKLSGKVSVPEWGWSDELGQMHPMGIASDGQTGQSMVFQLNGWYYLQKPHSRGPEECEFILASDVRDPLTLEFEGVAESDWYLLPNAWTLDDVLKSSAFFMEEILRFESHASDSSSGKKTDSNLGTRERNILLSTIGILCEMAKLDYKTNAKAADLICDFANKKGVELAKRTIQDYLKKIPDALATRTH